MLPGQLPLFPETTAPSSSLFGLQVRLSSACACGSTVSVLGSSKTMHEDSIFCSRCGRHRGWISKRDAAELRAELGRLGARPPTPMVLI
jgi:hypothetical protein